MAAVEGTRKRVAGEVMDSRSRRFLGHYEGSFSEVQGTADRKGLGESWPCSSVLRAGREVKERNPQSPGRTGI